MISRLLQAAPWGEWQWLVGLRGEESHSCRESVPAGVGVCVCDVQALPAATEFCCPLSCLAHTLAVPQLCSEAHREPPSAEVTGALGRHWVHPDIGCAVGEADKLVMVLHCFAGKEELKPVPSAAM